MKTLKFTVAVAAALAFTAPGYAQTGERQLTATAEAVSPAPLTSFDVDLRRTGGNANAFNGRTRIGLAGYNIGAFIQTRASASSGGSLFGNNMGARARMDFRLENIDAAVLQRVADAAHADLVAQLQAAGYEVAPASEVFAGGRGANMLADGGSYEGSDPGMQGSEILVVGPSGVGAVEFLGVGRRMIGNYNRPATVSNDLDAVLLFPNLALNFVETSGSGNRRFGNRARVEGEAMFTISPLSNVNVLFSRSGRFSDGGATLQVHEASASDVEFAATEQTGSQNNNAAAAVSAILGAGLQRSQRDNYTVSADPATYEALAIDAARSFNAALVAQIRAAREG